MPREFPEDALERIAADCEQTARDWFGEGKSAERAKVAEKWRAKAATIRQAIDAYREKVNAPPISRRQKFATLVEGVSEQMTPRSQPVPVPRPPMKPAVESIDHKSIAANDR